MDGPPEAQEVAVKKWKASEEGRAKFEVQQAAADEKALFSDLNLDQSKGSACGGSGTAGLARPRSISEAKYKENGIMPLKVQLKSVSKATMSLRKKQNFATHHVTVTTCEKTLL